jgi:lysozyme
MTTQASPTALALIKHFESFSAKAYLCPASIPTIGYGTTMYPDGAKVRLGESCTEAEATEYLAYDVAQFERYVDAYTRDDVTQSQFDALLSFCYNLGPKNLKESTLLKVINKNPSDYPAIQAQWMKWNKAAGTVLKGLTRRRAAEFWLYKTGTLRLS